MRGRERRRCWAWPWELRRRGVLSINDRNAAFVLRLNPRKRYPLIDDKALTKEICEAHGIRVPETYALIARFGDIPRLMDLIGERQEFVVKPAQGAGGRGVLVIVRHDQQGFETTHGDLLSFAELRHHTSTTLSGLYSLGGRPDRAIVEQRIVRHPIFERIAIEGTPDIRIIVYRGVPVMAMLRLPTRASRGRANLHQGAIGVGIDLGTGETVGGVLMDRAVTSHPDTGASVQGTLIPNWHEFLTIAMRLTDAVQMGYVGVDLVLDADQGPVVLEANARPGLAVQIANRCGLRPRIEFVDRHVRDGMGLEDRLGLISSCYGSRCSGGADVLVCRQ